MYRKGIISVAPREVDTPSVLALTDA